MNKNKTAGRWSPTSIGVNLAIVVFNAALIGVVWIAFFEIVTVDRKETVNAAVDRNNNLAIAFEQYTVRTIESADAVLQYMIREYARSGGKIDENRSLPASPRSWSSPFRDASTNPTAVLAA